MKDLVPLGYGEGDSFVYYTSSVCRERSLITYICMDWISRRMSLVSFFFFWWGETSIGVGVGLN